MVEGSSDLSRRERQIMDILFSRSEATVLQIQGELPDPPAATAIRTFLRILEDKQRVKRKRVGREFVYMPRATRRKAGRDAMQHLLETFFEGSLEQALSVYLTSKADNLSADELKRMVKLIQEAKKEK
jgi:predicted transcriptional regulator